MRASRFGVDSYQLLLNDGVEQGLPGCNELLFDSVFSSFIHGGKLEMTTDHCEFVLQPRLYSVTTGVLLSILIHERGTGQIK
jgi:hypothetical protein